MATFEKIDSDIQIWEAGGTPDEDEQPTYKLAPSVFDRPEDGNAISNAKVQAAAAAVSACSGRCR